jgi:hypothetical protein
MNARTHLTKWIGIGLIAALVALLAASSVGASAAKEPFPRGAILLPIHCDVLSSEAGDPLGSLVEDDTACSDLAVSEFASVEFTGNVAWARVVVGGETELHVYLSRDGAWERTPYRPMAEGEYAYMIEQENASLGVADRALLPVAGSSDIDWSDDTWAPQGEAYDEYFAEIEDLGAGVEPRATPRDVSIDMRGESYWEQFFAGPDAAATPSAAPSLGGTELNDLLEREIDLASGTDLNTVPDLVRSLFGDGWITTVGNEDLAREGE